MFNVRLTCGCGPCHLPSHACRLSLSICTLDCSSVYIAVCRTLLIAKTYWISVTNKQVIYGTDALRTMFDEVGLGWATKLSESPMLAKMVDASYNFLSNNRISLGGAMDAVIAAKRVEMSKKGVETCGDVDEECSVEW